jgi:hypothetical protein
MLSAVHAEPFDSDAIESGRRADERELERVYLPSPEEIDALKRQIRAENEARQTSQGGPEHLNMYRHPRVLRTDYSQGRIRKSLL